MRRGGVDSGLRRVGVVVADGDAHPLTLVQATTIEVGRMVPCEPRTVNMGRGRTRVVTADHHVDADDERIAAARVVNMLLEEHVEEVAIERVERVFPPKGAGGSAVATAITYAERIATRIAAGLEAAGVVVRFVENAVWQAKLCGRKLNGKASARDSVVRRYIRGGFRGWLERSNADQNDAAGVLLWSLPEEGWAPIVPRGRERARRGKGGRRAPGKPRQRYQEGWRMKLRAAKSDERTAAGCTCGSIKGHRRGCPGDPRATGRAPDPRNVERAEARATSRTAGGCTCGPTRRGPHRRGCPMDKRVHTAPPRQPPKRRRPKVDPLDVLLRLTTTTP